MTAAGADELERTAASTTATARTASNASARDSSFGARFTSAPVLVQVLVEGELETVDGLPIELDGFVCGGQPGDG